MEAGKTYRIRYVYNGTSEVKESILTYRGEILRDNIPIVVAQPGDTTTAGYMAILSIDELAAEAEVKGE